MSAGQSKIINVWGVELVDSALSTYERDYLAALPGELPTVEWVQDQLDREWHLLNLDNRRRLDVQPIGDFYSHPVWLMAGIFTVSDPASRAHRVALASYVSSLGPRSVADFGGGFGELARLVATSSPDTQVSIVEPFAHDAAKRRLSQLENVSYESEISGPYDVLIAQDVLEHVERPVDLAAEIASAARFGGTLIFANAFYPVEACHLPSTFYLRHTFTFVMRALGLSYQGPVAGCDPLPDRCRL